jgi:hypothetical protein
VKFYILIKFDASQVVFTFDFIEENLVVDILVGFHNSDFRAIATKNLRILFSKAKKNIK